MIEKYVKKPYLCSKCMKRIHMKRTIQVKVIEKSEGNKSRTRQFISNKPALCLDCAEELQIILQKFMSEFVSGKQNIGMLSVKCPGCDHIVKIDPDSFIAHCDQCSTIGNIKWNWVKPNGDKFKEKE